MWLHSLRDKSNKKLRSTHCHVGGEKKSVMRQMTSSSHTMSMLLCLALIAKEFTEINFPALIFNTRIVTVIPYNL